MEEYTEGAGGKAGQERNATQKESFELVCLFVFFKKGSSCVCAYVCGSILSRRAFFEPNRTFHAKHKEHYKVGRSVSLALCHMYICSLLHVILMLHMLLPYSIGPIRLLQLDTVRCHSSCMRAVSLRTKVLCCSHFINYNPMDAK